MTKRKQGTSGGEQDSWSREQLGWAALEEEEISEWIMVLRSDFLKVRSGKRDPVDAGAYMISIAILEVARQLASLRKVLRPDPE